MKFLLAPMATLSHEAMRRAVHYFQDCDEYYTEMIHASSLMAGGAFESYYIKNGPVPQRIVWQLTDSKPNALAQAAQIVRSLGGLGIDINMGCSANAICRTGAGIAWMSKPLAETAAMLAKVKHELDKAPQCGIPDRNCRRLSVKIRLGGEQFTEQSLFAFADMLVSEGVTQITLHPRTKKEKFRRNARWEYVEKLAQYVHNTYGTHIHIIGNGDIASAEKAVRFSQLCPAADGIMIGRAAVQKPWIFAQTAARFNGGTETHITESRTVDLLETARRFLSDLKECQPQEFYKTRAHRFFSYFCDNVSFAHYIKTKILNADTIEQMDAEFTQYFSMQPQEQMLPVSF
ncbi:MAG: tRNA-dihydrouridine synthase family protein [Bacteroides sp.]|nr:tRNA-dihydrouridine synthase family protein [Prevotella sp.]MCM1408397.1 tRNA-dihydrouridine synthase family protein [Treponema brennaborense]MCM1469441.1 tRNA-dihydrouridine synthase family protein [Bacteroides sp.]